MEKGDSVDVNQVDVKLEDTQEKVQIKKPKRIVHCSDGTYEEYSDDENGTRNKII